MEFVVSAPLCPLYAAASAGAERADELLCGWGADILEELPAGWCRVRTAYRYEGWARRELLRPAGDWRRRGRLIVRAPFADVLFGPAVERPVLDTLPRGALAAALGEPEDGWQKISLPDGREGYTKSNLLTEYYETAPSWPEEALRARAVEAAKAYLGTQYRWGGKSPLGIDCSGLAFMAWFFCGVSLYRDAKLAEGFPARPIPFADRRPGDLLYFPGHVALCLGEDRFIHSTAKAGSAGVVVNSLNPADPDFRPDLREALLAVGSVFPPAQAAPPLPCSQTAGSSGTAQGWSRPSSSS